MNQPIIRAGTMAELQSHSGDWLFVDIGFAGKRKTSGYLFIQGLTDHQEFLAEAVTYGELTDRTISLVQEATETPLHLVIEAPLSAAFAPNGNPLGRVGEKRGNTTRYWYVGPGCSVLVASLYLLKAIVDTKPRREVRVFEGLVSFKDQGVASCHKTDVEALKEVVWSQGQTGGKLYEPAALECVGEPKIESTLALLDCDPTPPPIVEVCEC